MKKYLLIIITLVLVFCLCSCNSVIIATDNETDANKTNGDKDSSIYKEDTNFNQSKINEKYLELIYETNDSYLGLEKDFNHKNVISTSVQYSVDSSVPSLIKNKINGLEKELHYVRTLYYPLTDEMVHSYLVDGIEGKRILINKDGSIKAIQHNFITLEISEHATPSEILPILEKVLEEYIDLSYYKYIDLPDDMSQNNSGGFGSYRFVFYNLVDGYKTDWMKISVSDEGNVYGFWISNLKYSVESLNVNKELENEMLELKFKDIYTTNLTEYKSFKIDERFTPQVVIRNDETYIQYTASAKYINKSNGVEIDSFLTEVLIPVELIVDK